MDVGQVVVQLEWAERAGTPARAAQPAWVGAAAVPIVAHRTVPSAESAAAANYNSNWKPGLGSVPPEFE